MPGDLTLEKTLPHNVEAERSVLGAILLDNRSAHEVMLALRPEHFFRDSHRKIYAAVLELLEKGRPVDLITLPETLAQRGDLDVCGGVAYVASLVDGVPPAENVDQWARVVRDKAALRQLIHVSNKFINDCLGQAEEPSDILEAAEQEIFRLSQDRLRQGFASMAEVLDSIQPILDRVGEGKAGVTGLQTRYVLLDEYLAGLHPGDLVILAARPSIGKTALALNIAQNVAMADEPKSVAIFSLEMTKEMLGIRLLCATGRVDSQRFRKGYLTDDDFVRLRDAQSRILGAPIWIDDTPGLSILDMRAKARRLKAERGLDLVIVDYLQLLAVPSMRRVENRVQEVSAISRSLKEMAKELRVPVMALSQLRRAAVGREEGRPQLSDLRESGSLEQDADVVLMLTRKLPYERPADDEKDTAEVIIAKQRNGPTATFSLAFIDGYARFENLELRQVDEGQPL